MNFFQLVFITIFILLLKVPGESWSFTTGGHEDTPQDLGSGVLGQGSSVRFLTPNNSRILAHHGSSVRMPCRIEKPPNSAMVTWTRHVSGETSLQLLSVGEYTHVSDSRFKLIKDPNDNNWELWLTSVDLMDGGDYLCQTSTHPPQHIITTLNVVDAYSEILVENVGESTRNKKYQLQDEKNPNQKEIFIKKGSQLKLKCDLKKATEKPNFIFWYHNHSMINYSPQPGKHVELEENGWNSVLKISSVNSSDGGNYTCSPHNIMPDTVMVTIMEGDGTYAAVYKDSTSSTDSPVINMFIVLLTLFSCFHV